MYVRDGAAASNLLWTVFQVIDNFLIWLYFVHRPASSSRMSLNASSARRSHTAIWTGSNMIVWGGERYVGNGFSDENTGGRYCAGFPASRPRPTRPPRSRSA